MSNSRTHASEDFLIRDSLITHKVHTVLFKGDLSFNDYLFLVKLLIFNHACSLLI